MKQCELLEKTVDDLDLSNIKVTQFKVLPVDFQTVKGFIKKWHYLGDAPLNISLVFGLYYKQNLIGAMIYGSLSMLNTYKKYGDSQDSIIELKRLCCIDKTKKNTESYFISKTLKFIKNYTKYKTVVSYSDPFYNHLGTIYKASNFLHKGFTAKSKVIKWKDKFYHDKALRCKDSHNRLKPFTYEIKKALQSGQATYIDKPPKHIYCYEIKRKNDVMPKAKSLEYNQMSLV